VSLKEAVEFVERNPHPRLWKLICEAALDKLDYDTAERCFVKLEDYYGITFVNRIQNMDEKGKQKAEIAAYFKRFDEAEQIYKEMDRKDLILDLRVRLGDWSKVV
jgi:WD repeat-containing protein 35